MSFDPDLKRYIRTEIARQMNIILTGVTGASKPDLFQENIEQIYPGADTILDRPVMHPFGFVSRAAQGTMQVVARQGEHPSNRLVLGHRDAARPTDLDEGTAKMYSLAGFQIYAGEDGIYVGKESADQPLVLGEAANEFFGALLDLLVAHVHPSPGAPSDKSADFLQLKTETIEGNLLLSTGDGGLS